MGITNPRAAQLARIDETLTPSIHQVGRVVDALWELYEEAKKSGKLQTAVSALKEFRAAVALKAQLTGEAKTAGKEFERDLRKTMGLLKALSDDQLRSAVDSAAKLKQVTEAEEDRTIDAEEPY